VVPGVTEASRLSNISQEFLRLKKQEYNTELPEEKRLKASVDKSSASKLNLLQ